MLIGNIKKGYKMIEKGIGFGFGKLKSIGN